VVSKERKLAAIKRTVHCVEMSLSAQRAHTALPLSRPASIEVSQCSDKRRIGRRTACSYCSIAPDKSPRAARTRPRRRSRCNSREGCQPRAIVPLSLVVTDSRLLHLTASTRRRFRVAELASRVRGASAFFKRLRRASLATPNKQGQPSRGGCWLPPVAHLSEGARLVVIA